MLTPAPSGTVLGVCHCLSALPSNPQRAQQSQTKTIFHFLFKPYCKTVMIREHDRSGRFFISCTFLLKRKKQRRILWVTLQWPYVCDWLNYCKHSFRTVPKKKSIVQYMMKVKMTPTWTVWLSNVNMIIISPCHPFCNFVMRPHCCSDPITQLCILSVVEDETQHSHTANLSLQLSGLFMCCCSKWLNILISLMLPSLYYSSKIFLTQPLQVVVWRCK